MTESSVTYFAEHYLNKLKEIGNGIADQTHHQDPKTVKVCTDSAGVITFDSLKQILFLISEQSKDHYYELTKHYRIIRRKSLTNLGNYHLAIECLEKEISLLAGETAKEVFRILETTTDEVDQAISYHLQDAQSRFELLQGLTETRTKHRMEKGESVDLTEKLLEKVFVYLKSFTADPKNFDAFFGLKRPAWNVSALYETYLFDKVWEEFDIEEEDILLAISSRDVGADLMSLIGDYRLNLAKIVPDNLQSQEKGK